MRVAHDVRPRQIEALDEVPGREGDRSEQSHDDTILMSPMFLNDHMYKRRSPGFPEAPRYLMRGYSIKAFSPRIFAFTSSVRSFRSATILTE